MQPDDGSTLFHEVVCEQVVMLVKQQRLEPNCTDDRGDPPLHRPGKSLSHDQWQFSARSTIIFDKAGLLATAKRLRELGNRMDVKFLVQDG